METYVYTYASLLPAAFYALGFIVLAVSQARRRLALTWFAFGTIALAVFPETFCVTTDYSVDIRLMVTGLSGAVIGVISYGIIHAMKIKVPADSAPT